MCLQRGTDWVFKLSGLRFVFKGLILEMQQEHPHFIGENINWLGYIASSSRVGY